ncbi:uncharacterized transposon-derived protein F54H12.3 [Trichonephila clavipes]|nr:uncharacterized transposon-derived protein F54H12.3 [Trichonephila clavipes]
MDLEKVYQEPEHPGSFGDVEALFKATDGKFSRKDIKKWLSAKKKDSYTLHKPIKKKFKKNRVLVSRMNQQYQADLVDMQSLSKFNDGYRYLLTCICVLSKYAWAIPFLDKNAKTVVSAFEQIFYERVPLKLQTDAGKEFTNKLFQNYLKKKKIGFFMTKKNTKRYIDVVDKLVYSNNNTWHRSIQMIPASVTETNQSQVWENLYGKQNNKKVNKPNYRLNDTVRISWFKRLFRTALPLTRGAKSVGKEVLKTGTQIVNDLLEGQNLEGAAKHRAKETGRKLAREAIKKVDDMLVCVVRVKSIKERKDSQNTSFRLKTGKRKDVIFLIRNKMAFLLKDSPECAKSELNLFTLPPTQTVIEKGQWIQFHPIANVTDGGPVEFLLSGSGEDYLDLSQTQLYVKAKILKNDGKVLTDDKIGPVNLYLHSLFSQVDISLNGRNVSSSNNTYPYRAILETIKSWI